MIDPKYRYRKAKKGDIKCTSCTEIMILPWLAFGQPLRCSLVGYHRVAKNNTCDMARMTK